MQCLLHEWLHCGRMLQMISAAGLLFAAESQVSHKSKRCGAILSDWVTAVFYFFHDEIGLLVTTWRPGQQPELPVLSST